ncbi:MULTISPECIES: substrate-binding domain-containing protein [Oceanimonas]|uniref:Transcriptional repressor PurR n=1 Tax=Oceanimonas doudoroffii TaxID=84158 RepID=A0A233RHZ3_9GAMM|nr:MULTISPECIES: substrate-binding domain-containing protein [Oceanimonas]NHI00405.1 Ribose operon repressor [Oceanimonas sp. MB9]OXY83004.1 transcriptional repressor PurR [Oceanimonas doudoroffii]
MATIKDVARLAGVSTSTVSHVLNKTRFVSPEITERVQQAIDQLHYTPSALARSLKVNQTRTLGMLVNSSANPFFAEVVQGVEQRCYELGYSLVLCNTGADSNRLGTSLDMLQQKRVDGIIVMCTRVNLTAGDLERHASLPLVMADWGPVDLDADLIQDSSQRGGRLATEHLLRLGHRRIGCITGPAGQRASEERLAGFEAALARAGLAVHRPWVVEGNFELAGGQAAMARLLALPDRPTAVFACNDMMAAGALRALADAGLHVPQDMSLVGYDNIELARYLVPRLTSIEQPKAGLGALAVDALLARIQNPHAPRRILPLEPSLVARESSAPLAI